MSIQCFMDDDSVPYSTRKLKLAPNNTMIHGT